MELVDGHARCGRGDRRGTAAGDVVGHALTSRDEVARGLFFLEPAFPCPLPSNLLQFPVRLGTRRVPTPTLPPTPHPGTHVAEHIAGVCQFRAREADVGGCRLGIPRSCNERFGTGVGERGPVRASGFEQIPGGVDVLAS